MIFFLALTILITENNEIKMFNFDSMCHISDDQPCSLNNYNILICSSNSFNKLIS